MADKKTEGPSTETTESLYEKAVEKMESDPYIVSDTYRLDNFKLAASMFEQVGDYLDASDKAEECRRLAKEAEEEALEKKYQNAVRRMEAARTTDQMEKVQAEFQELGDYKDSAAYCEKTSEAVRKGRRTSAVKRGIGLTVFAAVVIFIIAASVTGFFKYILGIIYLKADAYTNALETFEKMGDFLDSEAYALKAKEKAVLCAEEGDVVPFGSYKWKVLSKEEDQLLLIAASIGSDSVFYEVSFSDDPSAGWADSDLRKWLNGEIWEEGFSEEEKELVLLQQVSATENEISGLREEGTGDHLTLLSAEECPLYQGALDTLSLDYYLRTPGEDASKQAYVSGGSHEPMLFGCPKDTIMAVRPVIRIDLAGMEGEE